MLLSRCGLVLATLLLTTTACSQSGPTAGGDAAGAAASGLTKLPAPAGAKSMYADANIAMFVTEVPVDAATAECKKLLLADGWIPYGSAGEQQFYKRDLTRLTAFISAAPAQGGKTMIQYTQAKLTADLPPPPDAVAMAFVDDQKRLNFDSSAKIEDLFAGYGATLKKAGWEATTEKPIVDGFKQFQIFRNPQKEMLTLEVRDVTDVRRGHLEHMSAVEVEEEDRKVKAAIAKAKEKRQAEANKTLPKLKLTPSPQAVALLNGAEIKFAGGRAEFTLPTGTAKAWIEQWRKDFADKAWKEEILTLEAAAGALTYTKDDQTITINFVDPGFIPAQITITAIGVEVEWDAKK